MENELVATDHNLIHSEQISKGVEPYSIKKTPAKMEGVFVKNLF